MPPEFDNVIFAGVMGFAFGVLMWLMLRLTPGQVALVLTFVYLLQSFSITMLRLAQDEAASTRELQLVFIYRAVFLVGAVIAVWAVRRWRR